MSKKEKKKSKGDGGEFAISSSVVAEVELDAFAEELALRAGQEIDPSIKVFDWDLLRPLFDAILEFLKACSSNDMQTHVKRINNRRRPFYRRRVIRVMMRDKDLDYQEADTLVKVATDASDDDWTRLSHIQSGLSLDRR